MSTPIKRKLAAILSADVAGSSRLMGADEEGTLRLLAAHRAVVDSIIGFQDGRVVNAWKAVQNRSDIAAGGPRGMT